MKSTRRGSFSVHRWEKTPGSKYSSTSANDNENTTQNLWDAAKAVLRGKFIAIQSYFKKEEKSKIHNLTLQLKALRERTTTGEF